jgi:type III pantothenate kinase
MLSRNTAQLPEVRIRAPESPVGRSPAESIASGVFHGHVGAIREVVGKIERELFPNGAVIVGTGGHADLFTRENLFTKIEPELILIGLSAFALSSDNA